jgi:hypothetical protein
MMADLAHPYCRNRLFEWTMAGSMLVLGFWILIFPHAIGSSSFYLLQRIIGNFGLTIFFLFIGFFRIAALFANGRWKVWGGRIRAASAIGGAIIWIQMAVALWLLVPTAGRAPSPGIPIYFALAIAELISTKRARADGNRHYN